MKVLAARARNGMLDLVFEDFMGVKAATVRFEEIEINFDRGRGQTVKLVFRGDPVDVPDQDDWPAEAIGTRLMIEGKK